MFTWFGTQFDGYWRIVRMKIVKDINDALDFFSTTLIAQVDKRDAPETIVLCRVQVLDVHVHHERFSSDHRSQHLGHLQNKWHTMLNNLKRPGPPKTLSYTHVFR